MKALSYHISRMNKYEVHVNVSKILRSDSRPQGFVDNRNIVVYRLSCSWCDYLSIVFSYKWVPEAAILFPLPQTSTERVILIPRTGLSSSPVLLLIALGQGKARQAAGMCGNKQPWLLVKRTGSSVFSSFASLELQEGFTSHSNTRLPEAGTKAKITLAPKKNSKWKGEGKKKKIF